MRLMRIFVQTAIFVQVGLIPGWKIATEFTVTAAESAEDRRTDGAGGCVRGNWWGVEGTDSFRWAFDEPESVGMIYESSDTPGMNATGITSYRCTGVYGNAISFLTPAQIAVNGLPWEEMDRFFIAAWIRPTGLQTDWYREIYRQEDGDLRLLFSFQEKGRILSFGANIGGYVECDAPISPETLEDGSWHYVAATFDGTTMRVYLDGVAIGSLVREGTIRRKIDGAKAFIGSFTGTSEFYLGDLDELRIGRKCPSVEDIAEEYRRGHERALTMEQKFLTEAEKRIVRKSTFVGTLVATLSALESAADGDTGNPDSVDQEKTNRDKVTQRDISAMIPKILRREYGDVYDRFSTAVGVSVRDLWVPSATDFDHVLRERLAGLIPLLVEFRPITDEQWQRCSETDRIHWDEITALEQRYRKLAQTDPASTDPIDREAWLTLLMDVNQRVVLRPYEHEPVAPYQVPQTPETRTRTAQEADEMLRADWLHQAGGTPTFRRIRQEIGWARDLALRINPEGFREELSALTEMEATIPTDQTGDEGEEPVTDVADAGTVDVNTLYTDVRRVKRKIAMANPVLDFSEILFVDGPYPQGSEWRHEMRHYLGYMAVPGGRLLIQKGLNPDGQVRQLAPREPLHGAFWRPDLSWDADRIVFCFKPHNEKTFHLYEIRTDGTGLRQLTEGIYDDFDPVYLPDGKHIAFTTTRGNNYVRCMPPTNSSTLARCDTDGKNIYLLSHSGEPDYQPSVLDDGRIIHTRWEYTDKPLWRAQKLWTMNPDGTYPAMYWGNQSVWPDLIRDARQIPGSERVMMTGSAHHDWFSGSVGIIDVRKGLNFPHGLTKVTADTPWPECGNGPVDPVESPAYHPSGVYSGYYSPYPLSEKDFLVSACRNGKFVLYLMDTDGNRELIHEGTHHIFHAIPVKPRPRPPVIVDRVNWPTAKTRYSPAPGNIYSTNVYQNAPEKLREKAKSLRILSIDVKTYSYWYKRPYISSGPVVSAVQSEGVKRILGTVPIESDGSVSFSVPAGLALHFQLLDENGLALQTMRSFTGVMPGETRGCTGCHEMHSTTPESTFTTQAMALRRAPSEIQPPTFSDTTVSYDRYVQPILDRYCGECHQGDGEAVEILDLTKRAPPF
ncbi:MAG: LamG-like jellyroll fold domain-containing protein, partial [Planctomycetia bacterium]|nr:LamG-like jellyroll fold domain-containing protein [Planctomycetia bacterium]